MTKITRPVVRETEIYERSDALIVELHPRHLIIRKKGDKSCVLMGYGMILSLGRKLQRELVSKCGRMNEAHTTPGLRRSTDV